MSIHYLFFIFTLKYEISSYVLQELLRKKYEKNYEQSVSCNTEAQFRRCLPSKNPALITSKRITPLSY